jgi:hypothetical protein
MAQVAALRQAYICLRFTNTTAQNISNNQDINSLGERKVLRDKDIINLCKINNPQAGAPGAAMIIPNPGIPVSLWAETNLELASYWLRHQEWVSRVVTAAEIQVLCLPTVSTS